MKYTVNHVRWMTNFMCGCNLVHSFILKKVSLGTSRWEARKYSNSLILDQGSPNFSHGEPHCRNFKASAAKIMLMLLLSDGWKRRSSCCVTRKSDLQKKVIPFLDITYNAVVAIKIAHFEKHCIIQLFCNNRKDSVGRSVETPVLDGQLGKMF